MSHSNELVSPSPPRPPHVRTLSADSPLSSPISSSSSSSNSSTSPAAPYALSPMSIDSLSSPPAIISPPEIPPRVGRKNLNSTPAAINNNSTIELFDLSTLSPPSQPILQSFPPAIQEQYAPAPAPAPSPPPPSLPPAVPLKAPRSLSTPSSPPRPAINSAISAFTSKRHPPPPPIALDTLRPENQKTDISPLPPAKPPRPQYLHGHIATSSAAIFSVGDTSPIASPPLPLPIKVSTNKSVLDGQMRKGSGGLLPPPLPANYQVLPQYPHPPPPPHPFSTSGMSFADHLTSACHSIFGQAHSSLTLVKRAHNFFHSYATLLDKSATALHSLSSTEYTKALTLQPTQNTPNSSDLVETTALSSYIHLFDMSNRISQSNSSLAAELLHRCVEPLERCSSSGKLMLKERENEAKLMINSIREINAAVTRDKEAAKNALLNLEKKEKAETEFLSSLPSHTHIAQSQTPPLHNPTATVSSSTASSSSLLSSFSSALTKLRQPPTASHSAALVAARNKALRLCQHYNSTIEASNLTQARHMEEWPHLLESLHQEEEWRLSVVTSSLVGFVTLQERYVQELVGLVDEMKTKVNSYSVEKDIAAFLVSSLAAPNASIPNDMFSYDLPLSINELKAQTTAAVVTEFKETGGTTTATAPLFGNTIEACLEYEKSTYGAIPSTLQSPPQSPRLSPTSPTFPSLDSTSGTVSPSLPLLPLDVPRLVPTLLHAILYLDGRNTEGLFRLSPSGEETSAIRLSLLSHDYSALLTATNAHVPASLLKAWLRELSAPLVPLALYDKSIEIGKRHVNASDISLETDIIEWYKLLPLPNKRVMYHLLSFLSSLLQPNVIAQTRMTVASLSIVFAPSFLRHPTDDPTAMLTDSKYSCAFVTCLIEGFTKGWKVWQEEEEWSQTEKSGISIWKDLLIQLETKTDLLNLHTLASTKTIELTSIEATAVTNNSSNLPIFKPPPLPNDFKALSSEPPTDSIDSESEEREDGNDAAVADKVSVTPKLIDHPLS